MVLRMTNVEDFIFKTSNSITQIQIMKLFKNITIAAAMLATVANTSCGSFEDLNTDPTKLSKANPGTFMNPTLYGLGTYNWGRYYSFTSYIMQSVIYTQSGTGVCWWSFTDSVGDGTWSTYYRWLANIETMYNYAVELENPNYIAVATTLRSMVYQNLVDSFGDVPMSEACKAEQGISTPKFDTQEEIYTQLIDDLDAANSMYDLTAGLVFNTTPEMLYNTGATSTDGIAKWRKFTNSLRMRVLLRVLDVPGLDAKAKLVEMINNPEQYPVFESNEDSAHVYISGVAPEETPVSDNYWGLFMQYTKCFIDPLVEMEDPRLPILANKTTNDGVEGYFGQENAYAIAPSSYNGSGLNKGINATPLPLPFMNYSEIEFIRAELAQRGIISSPSAEESYKKGVEAAITQWNVEVPADYFENESTKYDGTLERIMKQKFYALQYCDFQQWFELNRTGYPKIPRGAGMDPVDHMPYRFKYPQDAQVYNVGHYKEAVARLGEDDFDVQLIWHNREEM